MLSHFFSFFLKIYINIFSVFQEQERSDLLDQYRTLSAEAEHYQNTNHQLESEGSNLRLEILTRESEIRMLKEKTERMDHELQEVSTIISL